MNKTQQNKVLRDEFQALDRIRSFSPPENFMPYPKSVLEAQKKIDAQEKIVERFEQRRREAWRKEFVKVSAQRNLVRRSIAFDEPSVALKMIDKFRAKFAKYLERD